MWCCWWWIISGKPDDYCSKLGASGGEFPPNSVSISLKLSTRTACLLLVLCMIEMDLDDLNEKIISAKTSRRTFFRACVFTIFLQHIWNGFIFFCGFYNVFLVPCIVLVSEMLSFTMVTKFNYLLIWKLHRFVLYEVVSKASRGSLLQPWFIRFLVFFQSNVFRKRVFFECSECIHRPTLFFRHCVAFTNLGSNGLWQAPNWSSGCWTNATAEAVHCVALWTGVTLQVWTCVKYVPKQSIP